MKNDDYYDKLDRSERRIQRERDALLAERDKFKDALQRISDLTMSQCVDYKHMAERQREIAYEALKLYQEVQFMSCGRAWLEDQLEREFRNRGFIEVHRELEALRIENAALKAQLAGGVATSDFHNDPELTEHTCSTKQND